MRLLVSRAMTPSVAAILRSEFNAAFRDLLGVSPTQYRESFHG